MSTITTINASDHPKDSRAVINTNFSNLNADKAELPSQTGNSGKYLTTNGSATSWGTVAAGALVLLEQHTASTSASLDFTTAITSTYDEYVVEIIQLVPATNTAGILFRVSTDGGSTFDSSGNYRWVSHRFSNSGVGVAGSETGTSVDITVGDGSVNTATNGGVNAVLRLYNPLGGAAHPAVLGNVTYRINAGQQVSGQIAAAYASTTAVNAFRILASSGNLTSGTVRVYGIAK